MTRINDQPLTIQKNDANACYNRIIANHVSLTSRRKSTPKYVCKLRANTLNSTQYHIQTTLGISKEK